MIQAREFVDAALSRGYSFWAGVPCSFLTPFINYVIGDERLSYIGAASEGEAVAIAGGAYLGGRKTVVVCQNSGLGNTVNPLTSFNYPFRIPTLLITTHRGAPGLKDEPQHELMGRITHSLLDVMEIPWAAFPEEPAEIAPALERAERSMADTSRPYAFVMAKGAVAKYPLGARERRRGVATGQPAGEFTRRVDERMSRLEAIRVIREGSNPEEDALIATTGKIGRELFTLGHQDNQLYLVGSMGCASAVALGAHQSGRGRTVTALDGDGALLMKMGALGTIGHYQPARFTHVALDNEAHESTGGQWTVSPTMDFAAIALASGYRRAWRVDGAEELRAALAASRKADGPHLIHVKVRIATDEALGRPTLTPEAVKQRFMAWMAR